MEITVYSLPDNQCPKCKFTKASLDKEGVPYAVVDLLERPDLVDQFRSEGLMTAPIVVVTLGDGATWTWNDYRHDHIKRLGKLFRGELVEQAA